MQPACYTATVNLTNPKICHFGGKKSEFKASYVSTNFHTFTNQNKKKT